MTLQIPREETGMKKKFIRSAAVILVLILALSFVFSGCSGKKEGEDGTTEMPSDAVEAIQTLKLPYSKADKLNPFTATSMLNQQLMTLIYDGLFALDKNYNPKPLLASHHPQHPGRIGCHGHRYRIGHGHRYGPGRRYRCDPQKHDP